MIPGLLLDPDVQSFFVTVIVFVLSVFGHEFLGYKFGWKAGIGTLLIALVMGAGLRAMFSSGGISQIWALGAILITGLMLLYKPKKYDEKGEAKRARAKNALLGLGIVLILGVSMAFVLFLAAYGENSSTGAMLQRECSPGENGALFCDGTGITDAQHCEEICTEDAGLVTARYAPNIPVHSSDLGDVVVTYCSCYDSQNNVKRIYVYQVR